MTIIILCENYELSLQIIFLTFIRVAYLGQFLLRMVFQAFILNCVKHQQRNIFGK